MSEPLPSSPLETLVLRTESLELAAFLAGSTAVRAELMGSANSALLLPLRGAMPMYWAADGIIEAEDPTFNGLVVELPIGTFEYRDTQDNHITSTSPTKNEKAEIIDVVLDANIQDQGLTILEEVQNGGTVVTLTRHVRKYVDSRGLPQPTHLIMAKDARAGARKPNAKGFRTLADSITPGVSTTVVPIPLIASDRVSLLDRVVLEGSRTVTTDYPNRIRVTRNTKAEMLFRNLGTMRRNPEIAHDADFVCQAINAQGVLSMSAANLVESWLKEVTQS